MTSSLEKLLVILGSPKAGTTALAAHLSQHPEICLGQEKEPKHFTEFDKINWAGPGIKKHAESVLASADAYRANFADLRPGQWALDASTDYLWCEDTPRLLEDYGKTNELRLIIITRDPVARAVSEYNHTLRADWEPLSFRASLDAESERMTQHWNPLFYHRRRSTICSDVHRYHEMFGARLLIVDYKELSDPETLMKRVCDFIGLEPKTLETDIERQNVSRLPRSRVIGKLLRSDLARAAARVMIPSGLRAKLWSRLHTDSRNVQTVRAEETEYFRTLIAEEIAACQASTLIPTQNWKDSVKP